MADMHTPLAWRVGRFFETFRVLHNLSLWELEEAGVITPGAKGGSDWKRFNGDLTTFILKLPAARVEKLFLLIESRLTPAPSQDAETIKAMEREAAKQKLRGDNHWETLRSIREIAKAGDCERIIQWVNDAGTGYVEGAETTLAKAMDRAASVEKVLIAARTVILEDRDAMFDSVTVAGLASTMEEIDRPHVARLDAILSEIDAALAGSAS